MIKDLVKVANKLDRIGLTVEADFLDKLIHKMAQEMAEVPKIIDSIKVRFINESHYDPIHEEVTRYGFGCEVNFSFNGEKHSVYLRDLINPSDLLSLGSSSLRAAKEKFEEILKGRISNEIVSTIGYIWPKGKDDLRSVINEELAVFFGENLDTLYNNAKIDFETNNGKRKIEYNKEPSKLDSYTSESTNQFDYGYNMTPIEQAEAAGALNPRPEPLIGRSSGEIDPWIMGRSDDPEYSRNIGIKRY